MAVSKTSKQKEAINETKDTYHVSQNKTLGTPAYKMWRIRKQGSDKTIKYFKTKVEAIEFGQTLARNNNAFLAIHGVNGRIQEIKDMEQATKPTPVKAPEPQPKKAAPKKESLDRYHITMVKDKKDANYGKWRLRKQGSSKTIKYFKTQKEAIEYADNIQKDNKLVNVHRKTGGVRQKI